MTNKTRPPTVREIVTRLGGVTKVARIASTGPNSVGNWQIRNNIPVAHWKAIVAAARAREMYDISLEFLAELAADTKPHPVDNVKARAE